MNESKMTKYEQSVPTPVAAQLTQNKDNFIILFYEPHCEMSMQIMPEWDKFVDANKNNTNVNIIACEYNKTTTRMFENFKVYSTPTVIKLQLSKHQFITMTDKITADNIQALAQIK